MYEAIHPGILPAGTGRAGLRREKRLYDLPVGNVTRIIPVLPVLVNWQRCLYADHDNAGQDDGICLSCAAHVDYEVRSHC